MIVDQRRRSSNYNQESLVPRNDAAAATAANHAYWQRMQHMYGNDALLAQHDAEQLYTQSAQHHSHSMQQHHHHVQYHQENPSLSPQQSSTSEADETCTPPPPPPASSLNRGITVTIAPKIVKKKKQAKKKRKDPNEPQKPVSPYALFFRDTQNDIKKKLANPSFGEISKVVAHMWENIEPEVKEQYKRKAATAKKEYLKQLAAYRAVQVSHQTPNMHHLLGHSNLPFDPTAMQHSSSHQQKPYNAGGLPASMMTESNTHSSHFASYNHHPHHHHSLQQYCQPPAPPSMQQQQFTNYHYMNSTYSQDASHVYTADSPVLFANHPHHYDLPPNYCSYDSNNNFGDQQQHYGLLRPANESELYSTYYSQSSTDADPSSVANENLLHNLNNPMATAASNLHYTDLTAMPAAAATTTSNSSSLGKPYNFLSSSSTPHGTGTTSNEQKDDEPSTLPLSNETTFHWNQTTCLATQW